MKTISFKSLTVSLAELRAYLFASLFVIGNLLLPQLCHLTPWGGNILLPIYFFTLVAAYKFGWKVGLLTAVFSPLMNSLLFGMPVVAMLPFILTKSVLLALAATFVASKTKTLSLLGLLAVILFYQVFGTAVEMLVLQSFAAGLNNFAMAIPGMLVQLIGGFALLTLLAKYE